MSGLHHTSGASCPLCDQKLKDAHPTLVAWFYRRKAENPLLHVSWAFRNELEQGQAVASKKSKVMWPNSEHNKMPSHALDLFEQSSQGLYQEPDYAKIAEISKAENAPILWGGDFKSHQEDKDHFQLITEGRS